MSVVAGTEAGAGAQAPGHVKEVGHGARGCHTRGEVEVALADVVLGAVDAELSAVDEVDAR
jgi:hypothetical protein